MQRALFLRNRIVKLMRDYFDENGFIDVETPILGRSTPEGARDYLVPSRIHHGSFYALPQSPQLYKQILMIAGYDRYVQVARCFRDEDLRADRQPEFTQLDMEMSFVDADDVMQMIDGLMVKLAGELAGIELSTPLPRMTYDEAMQRFGHDAPDLRFGMELVDCTDLAAKAEFRVFKGVADGGGFVRGINAKGAADKYSRRLIDQMTEYVQQDFGAKGLAWFKVDADGKLARRSPRTSAMTYSAEFADRLQAEPGDLLLLVADQWEVTCKALAGLRKRLGAELELVRSQQMHFSWVVEFPMFDFDEEEQRWNAMHHPFTAPRPQDLRQIGIGPRGGSSGRVRLDHQRRGSRWWHHPNSRPANARQGLQLVGDDARIRRRAIWILARCAAIRCASAWRNRAGDRPRRDGLRTSGQHSRLHRVSQDATRGRHDDRSARESG